MLKSGRLTEQVIGLAIEVHRIVRPAPLKSVYRECLCLKLELARIYLSSEVAVLRVYKGTTITLGFQADILVEDAIILEIKALASLPPTDQAQLLTHLRMSRPSAGLLRNSHAKLLKDPLQPFVV